MKRGLLVAALLAACTPATQPSAPDNDLGLDVTTPAAIHTNATLLGKASAYSSPQTLRIRRKSLGKPMLYIAATMQTSDPDSSYHPYQPRLVAFTQEGDTVILSDIRPRQRYTESGTLPRIIAQFPVVSEDGNAIEFNFAEGMKNAFTLEDDSTHDNQSKITAETPQHSYITRLAATADALSMDHHFTEIANEKTTTKIIRHIFKRDTPSSFQPREEDPTGSFGFFVTPPWYEGRIDTPHRYIARWDFQNPVSVAFSPGTPALIQLAIQDVINAWNTVFGKNVLVLSPLPSDRGPLDLRHGISINWVTNDSNNWAFGYMLAHPATGQILHGDMMIPSSILPTILAFSQRTATKLKHEHATPNGFDSAEVCNYAVSAGPPPDLSLPSSADLQTTLALRMTRYLITHELGHILGLRHNFAGSTEGTITAKQKQELLKQLAAGQDITDDPLTSSSIMDYIQKTHRLFMVQPGSYDTEAIQWAYFSPIGSMSHSSHRYCTDEDTNDMEMNLNEGTSADCQRSDIGADPLLDVIDSLEWSISVYISQLVDLMDTPATEMEKTPLAKLPSTTAIAEMLYRLHNYVSGQMIVWSLNDHTSIERIAAAGNFLVKIRAFSMVDDPIITSTRDNLAALINHGDKAEQLRAIDATVRLTLGIQKLEKLLDAPVGSLNKKPDGTAADSDHGG